MNCGISARKNNATFGFSRFVSMPWRNVAAPVLAWDAAACGLDDLACRFEQQAALRGRAR